ncbi:ISLre2 family transposase, partial [Enterococcus faecalis]
LKAVNLASKYYKEREEFRFYQEKQPIEKETISLLYFEGDGIQIKTNQKGEQRADLAHFVIHQGCQEEYNGRNQLMDKHEI